MYRRAPHHAIDGELLQSGPTGVVGLLMPEKGCLVKEALDALVVKLFASLQEGAGATKGRSPGRRISS